MTTDSERMDDVILIVGGNFTPDALSPEVYDAVVARVRANPQAYLDEFEALFLGQNFDALLQSRLHLPAFLQLLAGVAPDRVRATAQRLLQQYNAVLLLYDSAGDKQALANVVPEEAWSLSQRLHRRRLDLERLSG